MIHKSYVERQSHIGGLQQATAVRSGFQPMQEKQSAKTMVFVFPVQPLVNLTGNLPLLEATNGH